MRYYIATRLERAGDHNQLRDALGARGHEITYDWTTHGPVFRHGLARIREVAQLELEGVLAADFVVVLLPGGRGTHAELGMALATGKPVFLHQTIYDLPDFVDEDGCAWPRRSPDLFEAVAETCAFYHAPNCYQAPACTLGELPAYIAQVLSQLYANGERHDPQAANVISSLVRHQARAGGVE